MCIWTRMCKKRGIFRIRVQLWTGCAKSGAKYGGHVQQSCGMSCRRERGVTRGIVDRVTWEAYAGRVREVQRKQGDRDVV
jgi:hypothetical protein